MVESECEKKSDNGSREREGIATRYSAGPKRTNKAERSRVKSERCNCNKNERQLRRKEGKIMKNEKVAST